MSQLSEEKQGEVFIFFEMILWSLFPIVTLLTYGMLLPMASLAWTTFFSLTFFLVVSFVKGSWKILPRDLIFPVMMITLINGILFYTLFFVGLQHTNANNAAIIATLEIFFTYLCFNVWKKEFFSAQHVIGMMLIALSGLIILFPSFQNFQKGDLLILLAVMIVPLGNRYQKNLKGKLASEQILFYRTLVAAPFLFALSYFIEGHIGVPNGFIWLIIIFNGMVIFGLAKILWVEAIFRISVTKAVSLASVSPLLTILFAFLILGDMPTSTQIYAVIPAVLGIHFLTRNHG